MPKEEIARYGNLHFWCVGTYIEAIATLEKALGPEHVEVAEVRREGRRRGEGRRAREEGRGREGKKQEKARGRKGKEERRRREGRQGK